MPLTVVKTGLVQMKIEFTTGVFSVIGEAIDKTNVREIPFYHNVPGDANGGPEGPPIEVQWLGSIVKIRMDMSRWDNTEVNKIRKFSNATQGTILQSEVGTLVLANKALRVLLIATDQPLPLNFPCAFPREPIEFGAGTKWSEMMIEFEAHKHPTSGVLYNQVIV